MSTGPNIDPVTDAQNRSCPPTAADPISLESRGSAIGPYRLLEIIGEGGFGEVWLAEQKEPVKRRVAVKIIKLGMDTKQVVARFEAERQALAMMDHPNIAKVLDAGATDFGRPFFVMELVKGVPITEYCERNAVGLKERLELFMQVCRAIQHAHQKGIIHRDIKPSNILVAMQDGVAVPKVIDFGIAKATQAALTEKTVYTQLNQFIGTPAYMSPEQAEMTGIDIDTRSDIYSLGVLLYQLLTGSTPFDTKELLSAGLDEMRRMIREKEPVRPSTRVSQMTSNASRASSSSGGRLPAKETIAVLRGDLDWIVMKCLEKDRTRRYETANGLALDVQRHLHNETVTARPPSQWYTLQRCYRRNRLAFAAGICVAAALSTATIGIWISSQRELNARIRESIHRNRAEQSEKVALAAQAKEAQLRHQAQEGENQARRTAYNSDMVLALQAYAEPNRERVLELLTRHRPAQGQPDLRGWEWRYLWQQSRSDAAFELPRQTNELLAASLHLDGRFLVTSDWGGARKLWDLSARREVQGVNLPNGARRALAFSPKGGWLALDSSSQSNASFAIYDTSSWRPVTIMLTNPLVALAFSHDEKHLGLLTDSELMLWDFARREIVQRRTGPPSPTLHHGAVQFSADGRLLAAATSAQVDLVDVQTWELRRSLKLAEPVSALAFSPVAPLLATVTGFSETEIQTWNIDTGERLAPFRGHGGWVSSIVFSADGQRLISGGTDQALGVWDVASRNLLALLKGHSSELYGVALSRDGKSAVSAGKDGRILGWNLESSVSMQKAPRLARAVISVYFSSDSETLYSMNFDGSLSSWDVRTLRELRRTTLAIGNFVSGPLGPVPEAPRWMSLSPEGRDLAVGSALGRVSIFDVRDLSLRTNLATSGGYSMPVGYSRDGKWLITADEKQEYRRWGRPAYQLESSSRIPAEFSAAYPLALVSAPSQPDEKIVLSLGQELVWWNLATNAARREWAHSRGPETASVSPNGRWLATAGADDFAKVWDVQNHTLVAALRARQNAAHCTAFAPDGSRLGIGCNGKDAVKLVDTTSFQEVGSLSQNVFFYVNQVAFAPDGRVIVAIDCDGKSFFWHAPSFSEIDSLEHTEAGDTGK